MSDDYDVIIIGTGAGGGTLAYRLAPSGLRILLLERGDYIRREPENWDSREVITKARYKTHEKWIDKDGQQFHPGQHYYVGGQTKFYGSILFRLRETDFGEVRHHGGISPAWPLSYSDLEPYYAEAEQLYFVHGAAGEDPTEAWRSSPYPYPAVTHEPRIQQLHDDFSRVGLNPFHLPVGVMLDEANPQASPCIRCSKLDGFPCMVEAKADAHVCAVRPALRHENVTLLTNAKVERLETDEDGNTVTGVIVDRDGVPERYRANVVVVSCGAVNSAALLLRSANEEHPNGLANASGVVGRHYMSHINSALVAVSKAPNPTRFQKTLGVNDYYYRSEEWDFPLGHIQMLGKSDREVIKAGARLHRRPRDRLLAHLRGSAASGEPRHGRPQRPNPRGVHRPEPGRPQAPDRQAQGAPHAPRLPPDPHPEPAHPRRADPARRRRTPMRHRALRAPPRDLSARHQLQGARPRQPVRRRHELLPVLQRCQPGADGDGERTARRRPPDRPARRTRGQARGGDGVMKLTTL